MFEALSSKLGNIFKNLRKKGYLREDDIKQAMRQIRIALLEADVNFKVVKELVSHISERASGEEVSKSLTPAQVVIKIVHQELIRIMGDEEGEFSFSKERPNVVMLVGLQGSGKTTTAAKLARFGLEKGRKPLLVAADPYRPAAVRQLEILGEKIKVEVFSLSENPVETIKKAKEKAILEGKDFLILDTAGRLHIDREMMGELKLIKKEISPDEILLVVDAMSGQDAVNVAKSFDQDLGLSGIILTKLDSDARGGAALSIKMMTKKPIKFVGVGEKLEALEPFHPDRLASRILGMGDVLTLIERAEKVDDQGKAKELEEKLLKGEFNLEDFLSQLKQIKKMGSLSGLLALIPGLPKLGTQDLENSQKELKKTEAMINSMTKKERKRPQIIDGSRRRRIALGSGTVVADVNRLLKQFTQMKQMVKGVKSNKLMKNFGRLF
ncbi:signal recognition particle protein [bacterium]|nr:signal recognition particle protein [bacterium]MBU1614845.1 signal recognition particle protein [bacterium]